MFSLKSLPQLVSALLGITSVVLGAVSETNAGSVRGGSIDSPAKHQGLRQFMSTNKTNTNNTTSTGRKLVSANCMPAGDAKPLVGFIPNSGIVPVERGSDTGTGSSVDAVALCDFLVVFNRLGRNEHNDVETPLDWKMLCDDFEPLDEYLCPEDRYEDAICSHRKPYLNPAVRVNFCEPLFSILTEEQGRAKCTRYCINYVSEARGGCCNITCT